MLRKKEKDQVHTVMLMEFCAVSNILGHILVNERKGIVYLLMESQFQSLEDVEKAHKHGMDV